MLLICLNSMKKLLDGRTCDLLGASDLPEFVARDFWMVALVTCRKTSLHDPAIFVQLRYASFAYVAYRIVRSQTWN